MFKWICRLAWILMLVLPPVGLAAGKAEHVVVVVWDGLRPDQISPEHTPALHQLLRDGVRFQNHHSAYCTATEVNGVAIATGTCPHHSGIIANSEFLPELNPFKPVGSQILDVVRQNDQLTGGKHLQAPTLAEILQAAGKRTAIAGTKPVALLLDRRERGEDATNGVTLFEGKTLPASLGDVLRQKLGAFPGTDDREDAARGGPRDEWTTGALLDSLWSGGVPAFSLLWLSEPDSSQHAAGLGTTRSFAALKSTDRSLARVLAELKKRGLQDKTDLLLVSDHGFSTVERSVSVSSELRKAGFSAEREFKSAPKPGDILVAGQGGSVLFYVTGRDAETIRKLVSFLQQQDFTGVILTREPMEGAFTLDQAMLHSPRAPDVMISMRWSDAKSTNGVPGLLVLDGTTAAGLGSHGSLSRFDVHNTLVSKRTSPARSRAGTPTWPPPSSGCSALPRRTRCMGAC
jgi:predicted AlkP superfamily pyrophosphatase or phosphodiesterase